MINHENISTSENNPAPQEERRQAAIVGAVEQGDIDFALNLLPDPFTEPDKMIPTLEMIAAHRIASLSEDPTLSSQWFDAFTAYKSSLPPSELLPTTDVDRIRELCDSLETVEAFDNLSNTLSDADLQLLGDIEATKADTIHKAFMLAGKASSEQARETLTAAAEATAVRVIRQKIAARDPYYVEGMIKSYVPDAEVATALRQEALALAKSKVEFYLNENLFKLAKGIAVQFITTPEDLAEVTKAIKERVYLRAVELVTADKSEKARSLIATESSTPEEAQALLKKLKLE